MVKLTINLELRRRWEIWGRQKTSKLPPKRSLWLTIEEDCAHLGLVADIALMTKACTALLRLARLGYDARLEKERRRSGDAPCAFDVRNNRADESISKKSNIDR